jgi:phospho-N-acetylmuramoyl-pentapeptide-transferase
LIALLVAAAVGFATSISGVALVRRVFTARGFAHHIQDEVTTHADKVGIPDMGGLGVIAALVVGYPAALLVLGRAPTAHGLLVVGTIIAAGVGGIADDWVKIVNERNLGLRARQKAVALLAVAVVFAVASVNIDGSCTALSFTRCDSLPFDLGPWLWAPFAVVLVWVTSNSVNFTDGEDGLLAGSGAMTFAALAMMAFWQFRHSDIYGVGSALEFAIVAAALAAGCAGLLWWSAPPLSIFMGDTGSLAIGAGIATLVLSQNVALLLPILGALYAIEGVSSPMQIYWFRFTGGKRLFRMAPIHHHFELLGWPETTVLIRFWIFNAVATGAGVAIFYADALRSL